ncbi:hypothetical protein NW759_017210 [Fusarium solani]|nr:hypothetical protein NW759_017210 [Fusarium solani]
MLVGWGIAVVAVSIAGFWNSTIARTCIDSSKFYIGITVPNIIFDVLTVALPVHEVWRLQMGREKKLAITGVFLLGGSVVLASVARLVLFCIYRPGDGASGNNISQTVIIPHAASAIETCLAIIGACLPPCVPLFRRFLGGVATVVSKDRGSAKTVDKSSKNFNTLITIGTMSNRGGASRKWTQEDDLDGSFERLADGSLQGSTDDLYVNDRDVRDDRVRGAGYCIRVKNDIHVERGGKRTPADVQKWAVGDIPLRDMSIHPRDMRPPGRAQ